MFLLNEKKGWYNNLSKAGKNSIKLNIILSHELNEELKNKKIKNKDCLLISSFESSENRNNYPKEQQIEENDIFTLTKKERNNLKKSSSQKNKLKINKYFKKKFLSNEHKKRYRFHDSHMKNLKKKEKQDNPSSTKYNPKYNTILKGVKSLPLWEKLTGRDKPKKQLFGYKFYLKHNDIMDTMAGKSFIDMSKQTIRKCFEESENSNEKPIKINCNNSINNSVSTNSNNKFKNKPLTTRTRKNSDKKQLFSNYNSILIKQKLKKNFFKIRPQSAFYFKKRIEKNYFKDKIKDFISDSKMENSTKINSININNINDATNYDISNNINNNVNKQNKENESNNSEISNDSYDLFKHIYTSKKANNKENKKLNKSNNYFLKKKNSSMTDFENARKQAIKAPDFDKNIARKSLFNLEPKNIEVIPFSIPNFKLVREKPIMMVSYDKKKNKINKTKSASLINPDNSQFYDSNKITNYINNHKKINSPNFNLMTSRPIDNDPLPSYMKKIFDRNSYERMTEYSLKLNNYKNNDFISYKSSFWPKKSFNKVINLNLLKSKKFLDNVIFDGNDTEIKKNNIDKTLKFYKENCDEIIKEDGLPKFDYITYKSDENNKNKK